MKKIVNYIIPKTWKWLKLKEIADWGSGGTPKSTVKEYYNGDIPWLIIGDLNDGTIDTSENTITELGLKNSSAKIIPPSNVLVAMYGSIGKLGINKIPVSTNQAIAFTKKLHDFVKNTYLFYYLLHIRVKLNQLGKGGTQKNISQTVLKEVDFPCPPLREQHRIVAKIEELFSELDNGIESLKTARAQLKTYRQAVLKWAFEGKLTATWREEQQQQGTLTTAAELLQTIQIEREKRYQEQLEKWQGEVTAWEAAGKSGKKPPKPKKPKELPPLSAEELASLPALPEGWGWVRFGNITADMCLGKMLDKKKNKGLSMPYLRNINVRWGHFDLEELLEMKFEAEERDRYEIQNGDLIICEGGHPGRAAIWREQIPNMKIQKALHRVRFFENCISNKFILYLLMYNSANGHIDNFVTGTTIKHLTGKGLSYLTTPITSPEEQHQIVQEIESRLSICDQLEATIIENLDKAEALRQSILKRAFEGKLVPQDPNDEPASELLKRIEQEKKNPKQVKQLELLNLSNLETL